MDYYEKYEQALSRAKSAIKECGNNQGRIKMIKSIFPELKESEDEKMLREIKRYIKEQGNKPTGLPNGTAAVADMLAWLEKQGEHKPQGKSALEAIKEEKVDNRNYIKTTDKVEPEFHEGDWVVYKNDVCQIVKREEGCNKLVTVFGIEKELVNERNLSTARLWTIEYAKAGDVLRIRNLTFIFQEITNNNACHKDAIVAYCSYEDNNEAFGESGPDCIIDLELITPATKEQRELLFQKMKEAGYEWNAEKKELKKIEQKPDTDFSDLRTWKYIVDAVWTEKEGIGQYLDSPFTEEVAKKLQKRFGNIEQKPSWSEEDEKNSLDIKCLIGCYRAGDDEYRLDSWIDSLKCRVQPKQEWSEEDESMRTRCIGILGKCYMGELPTKVEEELNWLKSLKPRHTWKPSEEQIKAVKEAACYSSVFSEEIIDNLISLSKQLEKLREE